jgi:hypothetical protein
MIFEQFGVADVAAQRIHRLMPAHVHHLENGCSIGGSRCEKHIAAMDLFVVPTIGFDLLDAFVIVRLDRRDLVWINVTANPTAEWVARQITEAGE